MCGFELLSRLHTPVRQSDCTNPNPGGTYMATASNVDISSDEMNTHVRNVWIGIAVGAAVGIGIALSKRRRTTRWDSAKDLAHRVAGSSGEFAEATRAIVERVGRIYEESRRVVDDAAALWSQGRKLAGR